MANNKVQLADGTTLIDLTSDTVTPQTMLAGTTAHDASGELITGVVNLAYAGDSNPRANNINSSPGSSNNYSREDHVHPFSYFSYMEGTGSFLDWCLNLFTTNGSYYVLMASGNYTDWPVEETGTAFVQRRNNAIYIIAHTSSNLLFTNRIWIGDSSWYGWKQIARYSDIPSASTSNPVADGVNASQGNSNNYARADHIHPHSSYIYENTTGSFLDWCLNTFTSNGLYYVIMASGNYTGWPANGLGVAVVQRRNTDMYAIAHTSGNNLFINKKNGGDSDWDGWKQIARYSDLPVISAVVPFVCQANSQVVETSRSLCKGLYDPNTHRVTIDGHINNITLTFDGTTLFTVPEGYRPASLTFVSALFGLNDGSFHAYELKIFPDGSISQGFTRSGKQLLFHCEYII